MSMVEFESRMARYQVPAKEEPGGIERAREVITQLRELDSENPEVLGSSAFLSEARSTPESWPGRSVWNFAAKSQTPGGGIPGGCSGITSRNRAAPI